MQPSRRLLLRSPALLHEEGIAEVGRHAAGGAVDNLACVGADGMGSNQQPVSLPPDDNINASQGPSLRELTSSTPSDLPLSPTSSRQTPTGGRTTTKTSPKTPLLLSTPRRRSPWTKVSRKRPLTAPSTEAVIDLTEDDGQTSNNHAISASSTPSARQPAPKPPSRAPPLMNMYCVAGYEVPFASPVAAPPAALSPPTSPTQMQTAMISESESVEVVATSTSASNPTDGATVPTCLVPQQPPPLSGAEHDSDHERPRSTYLQHFEDAVETVMRTRLDYAHLFTPEEREVVQKFEQLSDGSKNLYVRLFQRKGPWFRVDGMLGYDEVGSGTPLWLRRLRVAEAATPIGGNGIDNTTNGDATGDTLDSKSTLAALGLPSSPFVPSAEDSTTARRVGKWNNKTVTSKNCAGDKLGVPEGSLGDAAIDMTLESPRRVTMAAVSSRQTVEPDDVKLSLEELTVLHTEIQVALRELIETGFLNSLPDNVWRAAGPSLHAVLAAVECCLRSGEIKALLKRTSGGGIKTPSRFQKGGKPKPRGRLVLAGGSKDATTRSEGNAKGAGATTFRGGGRGEGRPGMIAELNRRLAGQQTLWGAKLPLVKEVEKLVSSSVETMGVDVAGTTRQYVGASISGNAEGSAKHSGDRGNGVKFRQHWLVLIADRPRLVFKRALRLLYLTCDTSALSSGMVGAASVRGAGTAGSISSWSPGLSVAFGKARYARYTCDVRARAFEGREDFLRWEAAVELRCALDGAIAELPRGWAEVSTAASSGCDDEDDDGQENIDSEVTVVDSNEIKQTATRQKRRVHAAAENGIEEQETGEENERTGSGIISLDGLEDSISQFLSPAEDLVHASASIASSPAAPAITIALVCARCLHAHLDLRRHATLGSQALSTVVGISRDGTAAEQDATSEEDFLGMLKKACSGAAGREESLGKPPRNAGFNPNAAGAVDGVHIFSDNFSGSDGMKEVKEEERESFTRPSSSVEPGEPGEPGAGRGDGGCEVPEFLLQLEAGWVLASAVWEGVSMLERARDYGAAIKLLAQLLATRYTPHRRGRWWNRLSLDLAHVGRLSCALWASEEGVRDARVRGGDRLALEKRSAMLAARMINKTAKATKTTRASAGTRDVIGGMSSGLLRAVETAAAAAAAQPNSETPTLHTRTSGDGYCVMSLAGDDDDDIFVDPTVERERRRKQKRHRREQRAETSAAGYDSGHVALHDDNAPDESMCDRISKSRHLGQKKQNNGEEAAARYELGNNVVTPTPVEETGDDVSGGLDSTSGSGGDGTVCDEGNVTRAGGIGSDDLCAEISREQAAAVLALRSSEGLAELSEVSDLLNDVSVGTVVLAATQEETLGGGGARAGSDGDGNSYAFFGVPEITITGRRLNREVGVKSRFVGYGEGAACTVESLVLQHLCQQEEGGWAGWHCEGSPLRGLWTLLMWDVLFMDLPDVFQTPFQDAPLDLDFCPLFYLNRREAVDARLKDIRTASSVALAELVAESWTANAHTVCRGLRWERTSVRYLQAVAAGLGGRAVAAILAALCLNHKHFGGGLPDLLLMRAVRRTTADGEGLTEDVGSTSSPTIPGEPEVSTAQRFVSWLGVDSGAFDGTKLVDGEVAMGDRAPVGVNSKTETLFLPPFKPSDMEGLQVETWLLEVKGPSDRLSDRQTAWLRILHQGGARVGVCHVSEGKGGSHASSKRSSTTKA